jgi:hypothetical protein
MSSGKAQAFALSVMSAGGKERCSLKGITIV